MGDLVELRVLDHVARPSVADQIGLAQEIEKRIVAPVRRDESLVPRVGRDEGLAGLSGKPEQGVRPQAHHIGGNVGLGLERALGIGQPVFGDLAEGLYGFGEVFPGGRLGVALLDRANHRGQRLAAMRHGEREIVGHALEIGKGRAFGPVGWIFCGGRGRRRRGGGPRRRGLDGRLPAPRRGAFGGVPASNFLAYGHRSSPDAPLLPAGRRHINLAHRPVSDIIRLYAIS